MLFLIGLCVGIIVTLLVNIIFIFPKWKAALDGWENALDELKRSDSKVRELLEKLSENIWQNHEFSSEKLGEIIRGKGEINLCPLKK